MLLDLSQGLGIIAYSPAQWSAFWTMVSALVTLGALAAVVWQLKTAIKNLRQATQSSTDVIRNQHNWNLFTNKVDPGLPGLPSSDDTEYWKWRMTHLDHLNLLHTQWSNRPFVGSKAQLQGWVGWAQLLLQVLEEDRKHAIMTLEFDPTAKRI